MNNDTSVVWSLDFSHSDHSSASSFAQFDFIESIRGFTTRNSKVILQKCRSLLG